MAKRKKYPKLPNGFGSIKFLGKNRRNPYAVHPPTTVFTEEGAPKTPKALCYVPTWTDGFAMLTAYHAGTFTPELAAEYSKPKEDSPDDVTQLILANYGRYRGIAEADKGKTFSEVYEEFFKYKFERDKSRVYSKSSIYSTKAAFKNCAALHGRFFNSLRHADLQAVVDNCPLKHASIELIVVLMRQMYEYAIAHEYVERDYSSAVKINVADDDEHGEPFSTDDLKTLWDNKDNETVEMLIIMCYSGFRITEYEKLETNLEDWYFFGGIKTRAGKKRTVPIHTGIRQLVSSRIDKYGKLLPIGQENFRQKMYAVLENLGIERHTPHDCRHTFSMLCEKYKVSENDRKRMLGHSFGNDITNGIYGHRTVEELRVEIEKIKV